MDDKYEPGSRKPHPDSRLVLKKVMPGEIAPRYCHASTDRQSQEARLLRWKAEPGTAVLFRKSKGIVLLTPQWVICEDDVTETNEWGEVAP